MGARAGLAVVAAASFAVVLWGATPVATKAAVAAIDPIVVGMLRTILAGVAAVPLVLLLRIAPPAGGRAIRLLALSTFGGFVAFPILFTLGQRYTSATHGALILAAMPLFTGIFAAFYERRMPARPWWIGCAIAFAGEVVLISSRAGFEGGGAIVQGDVIILASTFLASLGYVSGARLVQTGYGTWGTTFWGVIGGSMVLIPLLPFAWTGTEWNVGVVGWGAVAYLAIGSTILAYVAWYWALGTGGIARIGLFQFFQPAVGVALAMVLLGETLTIPLLVSAAAILSGVFIAQRK